MIELVIQEEEILTRVSINAIRLKLQTGSPPEVITLHNGQWPRTPQPATGMWPAATLLGWRRS